MRPEPKSGCRADFRLRSTVARAPQDDRERLPEQPQSAKPARTRNATRGFHGCQRLWMKREAARNILGLHMQVRLQSISWGERIMRERGDVLPFLQAGRGAAREAGQLRSSLCGVGCAVNSGRLAWARLAWARRERRHERLGRHGKAGASGPAGKQTWQGGHEQPGGPANMGMSETIVATSACRQLTVHPDEPKVQLKL